MYVYYVSGLRIYNKNKLFQAAPQLLENIPEYTKENKFKSKLILIYTVLNKK
jgi:hypothetical protein